MAKAIYSIYIYTSPSNKSYVGVTDDIDRRHKQHIKESQNPKSSLYNTSFKRAIRKYGMNNFNRIILLKSPNKKISFNVYEKYYISLYDTYKNGYNDTTGGEGSTDYKHTDETKQHLSNIMLGKTGKDHPAFGCKHSKESREKTSNALKGIERPKGIDNNRSKKYLITFPNGDQKIITGLLEFCREYNLNPGNMMHVIVGNRKHHKGFKCEKL